jgi:hypothetical protein
MPRRLGLLTVAAGLACACLAPDDRPEPGSLLVTVSPGEAVMQGVVTADGWSVTYSRAIIALGRVWVGGGRHGLNTSCDTYGVATYGRIFNLLAGGGQKLSQQFALGQCDVGFGLSPPDTDDLLGQGVTEQDKVLMRTPGTDGYEADAGICLLVDGSAARAGQVRSFRWVFRSTFWYEECRVEQGGQLVTGVSLSGGVAQSFDIRVEVERLLRDDVNEATAQLRFEPFAGADQDGDGEITLQELAGVKLQELRGAGAYGTELDGLEPLPDAAPIETLSDYVYRLLLPTLPRFRGTGACRIQPFERGGNGHM